MKKAAVILALVTLLCSASIVNATPTNKYLKYYDDRTIQYVTANAGLNIRRQPNIDAQIIGAFKYGDEVQVLSVTEEDENWTAIYYEDTNSVFYVCNTYIAESKPEPLQQSTTEDKESISESNDSFEGYGDYLGTLRLTAYEHDGTLCANGNYPSEWWTCASNELPFGTIVYVDGIGEFIIEDRGAFGYGALDLFLGDPAECEEFGVQYADVWVVRYGY